MNGSLEHIDDLIAKVLAGEATREEVDLLEGWMSESKENRLHFDDTKKLFAQIDHFKVEHKVDSVKAWDKLNARITSEENSGEVAKVVPLFKPPVLRAAASIILICSLALLVNYVFNNNQPAPLILVAQQKVVEQQLPDGSKVTINKNSEIVFVQKGNVREVKLKGEAYFEVVHNEEQPFEITIDEIIIKDIGTAFNVKALPGSNTVEVLVESGEVRFYTVSNNGLNLVKGEKALYDKTTKQFTKTISDPVENTVSYKSKVFQFKANTLNEVIRQVNEVYGSSISLGDESLGNCRLSVMFDNENIDTVIEIIAETLDLEVERTGEKVVFIGQPCAE